MYGVRVYTGACVYLYSREYMGVIVCVTAMRIWSCDSNPIIEIWTRSGFVFVKYRYARRFEDRHRRWFEERIGSCSADQMVIQIQNRVILYECLLLHYYYLLLSVNVLSVFIRLYFCLIIIMFRYYLYMLITVHDHAHLEGIYTKLYYFEIGMYLINCQLDILS